MTDKKKLPNGTIIASVDHGDKIGHNSVVIVEDDKQISHGYEPDEEVTPICDICNEPWEDGGEGEDWNGETGNHKSCEATLGTLFILGGMVE